ncbi:hypothetical protein CP970_37460 [Streptomyces kanamyceticus]|uniref:Lipoprotein n=1 Tax=Streptomyces kanamyceticus TaxID=1967 RepID=A0A5J6GL12_STRKN|nr:hypothetical protein [Streptomyces kanamyceticus]QEU95867.1 hypothetical protein CP970_37460 [Streptomyces kanamyceticus]
MHRPTTTAALLLTVAVSATVTGCVSVARPAPTEPAGATAQPSAARTDGRSRPQIVQAPAREALERMGPPPSPQPHPRAAAEEEPGANTPAAAPSRTPRPARPAPVPVRGPASARPDASATRPTPATRPAAPGADTCTLGETYGGWDPDSPQAVICRETYGR